MYPASVKTLPDQLRAKGLTWKGYMEDMGNDLTRESATCGHPVLNTRDPTQHALAPSAHVPLGDQYAGRHNPFVYFHSIIDDQASCDANVVGTDALANDLASEATTRNYTFITPDLCHDGHDANCADPTQKGGLEGIDEFLQATVPGILASPAYQHDGLLIITFDEADADSSACCNTPPSPNAANPGGSGPGGGRVGALLISPEVAPGKENPTPYNHYALLCSIENLFGLSHLGFAGAPGLDCFGNDVYARP